MYRVVIAMDNKPTVMLKIVEDETKARELLYWLERDLQKMGFYVEKLFSNVKKVSSRSEDDLIHKGYIFYHREAHDESQTKRSEVYPSRMSDVQASETAGV